MGNQSGLGLDLSDVKVEERKEFVEGDYVVLSAAAQLKRNEDTGNERIEVQFTVGAPDAYKGRKLYHNFNIRHNTSDKAQQIGLSQLKSFLKLVGRDENKLEDVNDLVGFQVGARVKLDTYNDRTSPKITYFKEVDKVKLPASKSTLGL